MSNQRPPLVNGEIYHIVIRAVDPLKLFLDKKDYFRMIHDLFEFNDKNPASSTFRNTITKGSRNVLDPLKDKIQTKRELLVEILGFCLMPNHVHLLVRQVKEGGISKFMRKIGAGYGLYYNIKYKRKGHIFHGRYKVVLIKDNEQLKTIFVYIHTNPVALVSPNWKEKGIKIDLKKTIEFIENFRWSSYSDYLLNKNFPSVTSREFLFKVMGGVEGSREFVNNWLKYKQELADFDLVAIE